MFWKNYDVVVCGGGPSGVAAAVGAARNGAKTLLIERFGRLGGAGVTSMVNPLMGDVASPFAEELDARFREIGYDWERLDVLYADLLEEAGAEILLHSWIFEAILDENRVCGVKILCKNGVLEIGARVVVDATADGDVAFRAGAEFEKGRESDGLLQPVTIMFRVGGVEKSRALLCASEEEAFERFIGEKSWHDVTQNAIACGELPENVGVVRIYESNRAGERVVNATQINYIDGTSVEDLSRAEIEGRRQAVRVLDFLKKRAPGYENCFVASMAASIGVRETRRFLGENYLTRDDILAGRKWENAVVRDAFFPIDIHNPDGAGQAMGFAQTPQRYDIPLGCLIPREIEGLVLTGRCISGSHEAHASYRVQRIMLAVGTASGTLAAIAANEKLAPREVDAAQVQEKLGLSVLETVA